MDPEAAWSMVTDQWVNADEKAEAALNLLVWIVSGGYSPLGPPRRWVATKCEQAIIAYQDELKGMVG